MRPWLNFPGSLKGRYERGKYVGKNRARAHNRYTGKRAQNIAWVRDYLYQRLEVKAKRGHGLGREMLIACKWLLIIEGVPIDRALARMEQQKQKPKAKPAIKPPGLLKSIRGASLAEDVKTSSKTETGGKTGFYVGRASISIRDAIFLGCALTRYSQICPHEEPLLPLA